MNKIHGIFPIICFAILAACGGGGGGGGDDLSTDQLRSQGLARFEGKVLDSNGSPVVDAEVILPIGNRNYADLTDENGDYGFNVTANDFSGISPVALIINKEGYAPETYFYNQISSGTTYTVPFDESDNQLKPLAEGEFIPERGYLLWHLGDDNFSGSINSKLQVATHGKAITFKVTTYTDELRNKFTQGKIDLLIRGIQGDICEDWISIWQRNRSNQVINQIDFVPGAGPNDGTFGRFSFTFNASRFLPGDDVWLSVGSGLCRSGSDLDDFEFTELLVSFLE